MSAADITGRLARNNQGQDQISNARQSKSYTDPIYHAAVRAARAAGSATGGQITPWLDLSKMVTIPLYS